MLHKLVASPGGASKKSEQVSGKRRPEEEIRH